MMNSIDVYGSARHIVAEYRLHDTVPVSLDPLEELFTVRYIDLEKIQSDGAILTPPQGWPVGPDNKAKILLEQTLDPVTARLTLAHEIGHGICQHLGEVSSYMVGLEARHEREAWETAALLLIPERVVYEERDTVQIAAACEVPPWLVKLWPSISG